MTAAALTALALLAAGVPGPTRASLATAATQADTANDLAIIVHRSNPVETLTLAELRRIFLLETQTWSGGRKITLVLREARQPERAEALMLVCGLTEGEYERHVLLQTFRGDVGWGPRSIRTASAMLRFVFNVPGAIGYVWASETDDSTKVLRIDGRLPGETGYPLRRRSGKAPRPER